MDDGQGNRESVKLLIAASGTGGHLFPAIATALQIPDYHIEWLGVPDRLETTLVPKQYSLHTVRMGGAQGGLGLSSLKLLGQFGLATLKVRQLLQRGRFDGVFTTGGYIAAPAIIAARSLGLPSILHDSNALPGKVTRWLSPWCTMVALGFDAAAKYLPKAKTVSVGTPVRPQFLDDAEAGLDELAIPADVPLIVVVGGSQGAVSVNQLVRKAAPAWLDAGAWVIHQTGQMDPDVDSLVHPHYIHRPFFDNVAALFKRATLVISRAGAGSLTELAITHKPSILIPYPFAAEDHQTFNADVFKAAGAAQVFQQSDLGHELLQQQVVNLLADPDRLQSMGDAAGQLSVEDSARKLANLLDQVL